MAAFWEILLFCTWGDAGCWEPTTQHFHKSWTPAQKGQGLSLKNPNGDLGLEQKKGLTPLDGLPSVVIPCDCIRDGKKTLPRSITKLRTKAPRKNTGVDGSWMKEGTLSRKTALSFDWYLLCSGEQDFVWLLTLLYVYKLHQKDTCICPQVSSELEQTAGPGIFVLLVASQMGSDFWACRFGGFILQCR